MDAPEWVIRALAARSLADTWRDAGGSPLGQLLARPGIVVGISLAAYFVWLPFGALFSLLAHAVTTPAVLALSLLSLTAGGRWVARLMVFPASLPSPKHSMDAEYGAVLRREVAGGLREAEARLVSVLALQRRAAGGGGGRGVDPPLSLPPHLGPLLLAGTAQAGMGAALTAPPDPAALLQPGPAGALCLDSFLASVAAMVDAAGVGGQWGESPLPPHAALLLHYGTAAQELSRCIDDTVASALRQPLLLRDRGGVRSIAARLMSLPVVWSRRGGGEDDDLLSGAHGVSADQLAALSELTCMPRLSLLLSPSPPHVRHEQCLLAVKQALSVGGGGGVPLTVKQVATAALSCFSMLHALSPWLEAVPHYGLGGRIAGEAVAAAAGIVVRRGAHAGMLDEVEGGSGEGEGAEVEAILDAQDAQWWRDRVPGWVSRAMSGGGGGAGAGSGVGTPLSLPVPAAGAGVPPGGSLLPAPASTPTPTPIPAIVTLLGLTPDCAAAARAALDGILSGHPPVAGTGSAVGGQAHGSAAPAPPTQASPSSTQASGRRPQPGRINPALGMVRGAMASLSRLTSFLWHAGTVWNCSPPVLGPAFLRAELGVRGGAQQVWVETGWRGKQRVHAVVIPSLATLAAWRPGVQPPAVSSPASVLLSMDGRGEGGTRLAPPHAGGAPSGEDPFASLVANAPPPGVEGVGGVSPTGGAPASPPSPPLALHAPLVVILCAPNAGMWEHALRHNHAAWVYGSGRVGNAERGVATEGECLHADVIVWNYAGVGRSTGSPSLSRMWKDVAALVAWARAHAAGGARVVVHGESLGGLAACWAGGAGLPDVVVADRTFSSLPRVARSMLGAWAEGGLRVLTGWSASNSGSWVGSPPSLPRILLVDPHDQVLGWEVSLAKGVAEEVVVGGDGTGGGLPAPPSPPPRGLVDHARAALATTSEAAGDCLASLRKRLASSRLPTLRRGRGASDHASDTPDGEEARVDPVEDTRQGGAGGGGGVVPLATAIPFPPAASFTTDFLATSAHLHYLLLALTLRTAVVFARPQLAAMVAGTGAATSGGVGEDGEEGRRQGSIPPLPELTEEGLASLLPPPSAPSSPADAPASPSDKALARILSSKGIVLDRTCAAFTAVMDESYGRMEGLWQEISASVSLTAVAVATRAETEVAKAGASSLSPLYRDSHEFGQRMQGAAGGAALTAALAGCSNGLGHRLGEAWARGVSTGRDAGLEATRGWLAGALLWGWPAQAGHGPAAELAAALPRPLGYPPAVGALDPPCLGMGRPVGYLEAAHECGLDSTARRVQALLVAAQGGVTGAGAQGLGVVPADLSLLREAAAVVASLHRLRAAWTARQPPAAATAAGALRAPAGLCIPLSCGHNVPWSRREGLLLVEAVRAATR